MQQISLLLGAGFSVPAGYPTAGTLNAKITGLQEKDFFIFTDGSFGWLKQGQEDPFWYSDWNKYKKFLIEFIEFYSSQNEFNYEEFYDYAFGLYNGTLNDEKFSSFCDQFKTKYSFNTSCNDLLYHYFKIFNQVVVAFLKDKYGQSRYNGVFQAKPTFSRFPQYTAFLNCLEALGADSTVHIHTLNHDVFFEQFESSAWLQEKLSDGFTINASPYFGLGDTKQTLSYYTGEYNTNYRLYKLHGSIDYYPFHIREIGVDAYVKVPWGISTLELYKEVQNAEGEVNHLRDWINYHSDFLSGTNSKILRYRETIYYEKAFVHFEQNLEQAEKLIIIGYGCFDAEINAMIGRHFASNKERPIILVNPYPNENVSRFCQQYNVKLLEKSVEHLCLDDFN